MLHNTGPYGPNETPVNMGAPKIPELASPMDIAPNFDHFMKMSQQAPQPPPGHFNLQNYVGYAGSSVSSTPQMGMFRNYNYSDNHGKSFVTQTEEANLTNHFLHPMLHNGNILEDILRNNDDNQKAVDFSNIASNLANTFKARDRPQVDNPTMSIVEMSHFLNQTNTQRYFDNNTTKQSEEDISEKTLDVDPVNNHDNVITPQINATEYTSDDESSNSSKESTKDNAENNENNGKVLLSYLKNTESNQNMYKQDDSDESINEMDNEDTLKKVFSKTNHCKKEDSDSDSDDGKPLNLVHFIKQEPIDHTDTNEQMHESVVVKVEPVSTWTDTEHMQPFLKDVNGVSREDSSLTNIVDSVHSVAEATEIVRNGEETDFSFECPSCYLLFSHPKRFLIHTKWHSFGLINEKRIEEANEKLACRKQRKEMKKEEDMVKKEAAAKLKAEEAAAAKPSHEVFSCKDCDKKFNTKSKLRNHRHKYHPSREHECKICNKKVMGWYGLQTHMAANHNKTNNFVCDVCEKGFKHAHSLAKHRDTHREKTHGCAECPKKFGSATLLKIHMRSHERAQRGRTFRCSYCGKGFYEAYTLQYHERTHRNERPFKCEICETSYGTNSSLKRHLKVSHFSNAKPFECDTCRRCFSTELIRDRHAARYHGAPTALTYACTECTCRYLRHKDLKRHMYRIHPKGKNRRKESDSE